MKQIIESVREFHTTFNHPVVSTPGIPSPDREALRTELIQEELNEFTQASTDKDIVGVADALGDILYVVGGAILEYGLQDKMPEIFDAIHKSNMTKACNSDEEASETMRYYEKQGIKCTSEYREELRKWVVVRYSDNKILKSINYTPVDIKSIIDR